MIETMLDDWANSITDEAGDDCDGDEPEPSDYYYEEP
jgi:hypothetical protein